VQVGFEFIGIEAIGQIDDALEFAVGQRAIDRGFRWSSAQPVSTRSTKYHSDALLPYF
jgi:hypothetical protein